MLHQCAVSANARHTKAVFRAQNRKVSSERRVCGRAASTKIRVGESRAESLVQELEQQVDFQSLRQQIENVESELQDIDSSIDHAYANVLSSRNVESENGGMISIDSAAAMKQLARDEPQVAKVLLEEVQKEAPTEWAAFQAEVGRFKLARSEREQKLVDLKKLAAAMAAYEDPSDGSASDMSDEEGDDQRATVFAALATKSVNIVMVTGIEAFNQRLYRAVAKKVKKILPGVSVSVFSDTDIRGPARGKLEKAIAKADVFFCSLVFDYDEVEWLKERVSRVPVRFVFESAIELMSETRVGEFEMNAPAGKKTGPPPAVKKLLEMFGSGKEEDKLAGYLSFLKVGPKILKFVPMQKAQDLRAWLTVYGYWNEGGKSNVVEMMLYIVSRFFSSNPITPAPPISTPPTGCLHPDYNGYFETPKQYLAWYKQNGALRGTKAPVAAVLLYRKHVVTGQNYIQQLVRQMESEGVIPIPIFLNGVEAHTVVRDQLTTAREQAAVASGSVPSSSVSKDAAQVDVIVNTVGFPLVGGPAGTMEGGRQAEVAREILSSKNVPYMVTAPLLIQDLRSWTDNGVAGLQSVVLYSLPELDGSVDTVPLGGLVGEDIYLIGERVTRLLHRIKKWTHLASTPAADRKLGILLYGFPPGVGAVGTAALLNVPESLEQTLKALRDQGYDLGEGLPDDLSGVGEKIVSSLTKLESPPVVARGAAAASKALTPSVSEFGAAVAATEVPPASLRDSLAFDDTWGPTEWGPIPFLPPSDMLSNNMEAAWGSLDKYRGLNSTSSGNLFVGGLQLGNVWIGVQPMLGVEGDPMRLLFDRDLTPHPQYAAFYRHLTHTFDADALIHFGMHGTVEWLPGSPLGNTGFSWSDVLMSSTPNVYIYAANNPSESIIAKRRGYGTIVSHNVPPYGRAGLYKQLVELQGLLQEYRDDPASNSSLKEPIVCGIRRCGLEKDCPFVKKGPDGATAVEEVIEENVAEVPQDDFQEYCSKVYGYLQEVSNRLFSEGLHTFGKQPSPEELFKYLQAYLEGSLSNSVIEVISNTEPSHLHKLPSTIMQNYSDELRSNMNGSPGSQEAEEQLQATIMDAITVRELLDRNTEEVSSLAKALNGEYVLPQAGGDLLRDGPGVLPTGRNIHALDPYRMPSTAAFARGTAAGEAILQAHADANDGALPETVAVNLWGLDSIKSRGDNVGLVLWLVGAQPVRESTGRIARFELVPLEELGRPRIDVLCNMSGIFRDSFQNVVELLDDMFQRAAAADEPEDMNLIRKHAKGLQESGEDFSAAASRLFSNPAGDYGSMVNERVGASNWNSSRDLGDTWASRNAFSYGRGDKGTARLPVLQSLLSTTDRVVQQIDSVEYGLTDIQEYYANTGALISAAEGAREDAGRSGKVNCSVLEAFSGEPKPAELDKMLRVEYRSKLLNPKWAEAMAAQGSGGAFEISQRMTAMLGWGATVFREDWTWTQSAEMYVMDSDMANTLRSNNPEAFRNVVARMLEAAGRGMWDAPADILQKLHEVYADLDEQLEKADTVR